MGRSIEREAIAWTCPDCGEKNEDTREHYVLCVWCGSTFEEIPKAEERR